jgi:hypothetical protein
VPFIGVFVNLPQRPRAFAPQTLVREVLRLFERFDHDVHDATQPTLEDVLTHLSAQIAALTQEVKELRALKEDVDELRAFNDARLVQLEESNEDLVSMTATPKVVIVQPKAPFEATQPPADQDMEELFQEVKGRKPRKRRPSVASLEDQAVEPGPSHGPLSAEVPKKAKKANPQAPQANPNRPAPAKQVAQNKPPAENKIPPIIIRDAAKWVSVSSAMTTRQIKFSKAKACIDGIRVNTVTVHDFRALTRLLEERKVPYHSSRAKNSQSRLADGPVRDPHRRCASRPGGTGPGTDQDDQNDLFQVEKTSEPGPRRGPQGQGRDL